jgi:hypothetical protein
MLDFGVENYLEKSPQVGNSGIFLICFLMKNHCVSVGMRFSLNHVYFQEKRKHELRIALLR